MSTSLMQCDSARRAASHGVGRGSTNIHYRAVTPHVAAQDRDSLQDWRRAYDNRFNQTSLSQMQSHTGECVEQIHRTHAAKQEYFKQHELPNLTWMDLNTLTHERSLRQRQPAYYGDVGGPARMGVLSKRQPTPLCSRVLQPAMNLNSKSMRGWGM
eukprot:CAMPEP_0115091356 /NCGR_PEP_ID=MMETSP0227-20121206/26045_1 /TAXON_ID=89957 /ORGANISM="Polarella glacialis, Strain CCMP 1383" /LENGTH=155 /DNA_ID=CAMNT_0002482815 /DNA_START=124 /DNA_END=591 /DNA_ORIENTATION=+